MNDENLCLYVLKAPSAHSLILQYVQKERQDLNTKGKVLSPLRGQRFCLRIDTKPLHLVSATEIYHPATAKTSGRPVERVVYLFGNF